MITKRETPNERKMRSQSQPHNLARRSAYKRKVRADQLPVFKGVDTEGVGRGKNARPYLLGCGDRYLLPADKRKGLQWKEVLEWLYHENFEQDPAVSAYIGFYLRYDFNMWLKSLPYDAAASLFTSRGKAMRKIDRGPRKGASRPVKVDGWEIDMPAGWRMLKFRPEGASDYMYICDSGSFFQTSLLTVLETWPKDDRLWTDAEYQDIKFGKENLRTVERFNKKMIHYNELENAVLARIMTTIAEALRDMGIKLTRDRWYGPGPVAATWLSKNGGIKHRDLIKLPDMEDWLKACQYSYYGGWFEIFSHGIIRGLSYNYDINSAYPYATTKLPHLCDDGRMRSGKGSYKGANDFVLLYCTVHTKGTRIGAMPYRDSHGSILRPSITKGWYWKGELDAANRAGLVKKVDYHEYREYIPCNHPSPYTDIGALYEQRKTYHKESPKGKAIKTVINSVYGKFAQTIGGKPYNNWFYASYITSHCRTQILDAIATHPRKADAVLMVATDGICFDSPHPTLPTGDAKRLGEWDGNNPKNIYEDLVLFKPGVYWDKVGKERLQIKSRGVSAKAFAKGVDVVEDLFRKMEEWKCVPGGEARGSYPKMMLQRELWDKYDDDRIAPEYWLGYYGWPQFIAELPFSMVSCPQALARGKWETAGRIQDNVPMVQSSFPGIKRDGIKRVNGRLDTFVKTLDPNDCETKYYKTDQYKIPVPKQMGFGFDGDPIDDILEAVSIARDKKPGYDIEIDEDEWITVWNGGPV